MTSRISDKAKQRIRDKYEAERSQRGVEHGTCFCGCGRETNRAPYTNSDIGWLKDQPKRFIYGHGNRSWWPRYVETDLGYDTPCWIWQHLLAPDGYGRTRVGGQDRRAHRVEYERAHGPIPPGKHLDHLCMSRTGGRAGSRACIRPSHLEPVTPAEHVQRSAGAKLTEDRVRDIRFLAEQGEVSRQEIADMFGVSSSLIHYVVARKVWKSVT